MIRHFAVGTTSAYIVLLNRQRMNFLVGLLYLVSIVLISLFRRYFLKDLLVPVALARLFENRICPRTMVTIPDDFV
jgi:hypothetical protein